VRSTSQKKSALASLPSEGRVGIAGGSIGQSALFWLLFWASKKVTSRWKRDVCI